MDFSFASLFFLSQAACCSNYTSHVYRASICLASFHAACFFIAVSFLVILSFDRFDSSSTFFLSIGFHWCFSLAPSHPHTLNIELNDIVWCIELGPFVHLNSGKIRMVRDNRACCWCPVSQCILYKLHWQPFICFENDRKMVYLVAYRHSPMSPSACLYLLIHCVLCYFVSYFARLCWCFNAKWNVMQCNAMWMVGSQKYAAHYGCLFNS